MIFSRVSDLLFLGASVGQPQAHDSSYPDDGVVLLNKVIQQRIGRVVLVLHPAIEDAHR